MEDSEFQASAASRIFGRLIKFVILVAICYVVYLYFTRPELDLSESYFMSTMRSSGYNVYKFTETKPRNVRVAYTAMNKNKTFKINYLTFTDAQSCKEFFDEFMNKAETKHNLKIDRDYRIDRIASEKQTYFYEYSFYAALYANNSIVYAKTFDDYSKEVEAVFVTLNKPTKFTLSQLQSMSQEGIVKK